MYFGEVLFGTITTKDAVFPTGTPANPEKFTVLFAEELAVNTTIGEEILIVTVALITVVTFEDSITEFKKFVVPFKLIFPVVTVFANRLPVMVPKTILAPVIVPSTILFALIAVRPIFGPVIVPSTILFALMAVRPSFGPVTAPSAKELAVTDNNEGTLTRL